MAALISFPDSSPLLKEGGSYTLDTSPHVGNARKFFVRT